MPQPVDLQTEIARITATERIQQVADRASLAAQQRAAIAMEETRVSVETQVQQTDETENEEVDENGRRKNPFMGRRRKRAKGEGAVPQSKTKAGELRVIPEGTDEHRLDVTI
jgi:hypothetical protein